MSVFTYFSVCLFAIYIQEGSNFAECTHQLSKIFGGVFRVYYVSNHIICKKRYINFFFSYLYPLSLPHVSIALTKTSISILNKYEESGQPFHVPDFSGNALSFCLFILVLAVDL